jgi:uncharacterized caspase-like protein
MRRIGAFVVAVCATWLFCTPAMAEKRVALVIGNSVYENVAPLANPANDATAVTSMLKQAGFDIVESRRNLKIAEMRRAFRDFVDKSRDADIAVVYYAGHGIEIDGTNYIVPVDASLERDLDAFDEAFPLDRILVTIEPAKQLRLVILDACRDNPFAKTMKRVTASRAIGRGLAKVEPSSPNTLIAFASKAGSTALDGDSKHSPFTSALVKHIATPGLDLRKAFGYVRDDVLKSTSNRQEPYVYGSLGGDDFPLVRAKPAVAPPNGIQAEIRRDYELAERVGTREVWTAFLAQYPEGLYATLARGQLNKIAAEEARVAATANAQSALEEKDHLAATGAQQTEQSKAAAQARAAEQARVAAEKAQQIEQAKVVADDQARLIAEKAASDSVAQEAKLASLPPEPSGTKPEPSPREITRSVQSELKRVGCFSGAIDGEWTAASRRALEQFNNRTDAKLNAKLASLDVLDAIKARSARVCPLNCDHGFRAEKDSCVRIACRAGYFINDNECEKKREKPQAKREPREKPKREQAQSDRPQSERPKPQASGTIICNQQGCRPMRPGCRFGGRYATLSSPSEVCK